MFRNTYFFQILLIFIFNVKIAFSLYTYFHLYTRNNQKSELIYELNIKNSSFSYSKNTYFIIHGWNSASYFSWVLKIKDNLLHNEDANVIAVDWTEGSSGALYPLNAINAITSGNRVGDFIKNTAISPSTVHCIGHSLGAHVCGFAGKKIKLKRISGLDPAGPVFKGQESRFRLDKSDANYVDVIHTDQTFGIQDPIGHKNFYPNGGQLQAGCLGSTSKGEFIVEFASCSHGRVTQFFAESIISDCKFTATLCNNYDDFKTNQCVCSNSSCSYMGFFSNNIDQVGKFYLKTNGKEPFCIN